MTDPAIPQTTAKLRKLLWRRILKWTLRIVAVLVVVIVLIWSVWYFVATHALDREIAGIISADEPVTFADLTASLPEVDRADDAAPYYTAALALIEGMDYEKLEQVQKAFEEIIEQRDTVSPALIASVEDYLAPERLALEMIDKAATLGGCSYDIGVEYGMSYCTSRFQPARLLALTTSVRTEFLALQGQGDQAVESAVSSLRMLRIFDRQPMLICHLVRVACLNLITSDIPVILEFSQPSDQALDKLQDALLQSEQSFDIKRMWLAERVYVLSELRNILPFKLSLKTGIFSQAGMLEEWPGTHLSTPFVRSLAANYLDAHSQLVEASEKDWPEVLTAIKDVGARQSPSMFNTFSRMLIPGTELATEELGKSLATTRAARLAIMVELYRREQGKLPESLAELQTGGYKVPVDPFTGKELVYRKSDSEYLVYSLGDDLQDNGGPTRKEACSGGRCGIDSKPKDWGVRVRIASP